MTKSGSKALLLGRRKKGFQTLKTFLKRSEVAFQSSLSQSWYCLSSGVKESDPLSSYAYDVMF